MGAAYCVCVCVCVCASPCGRNIDDAPPSLPLRCGSIKSQAAAGQGTAVSASSSPGSPLSHSSAGSMASYTSYSQSRSIKSSGGGGGGGRISSQRASSVYGGMGNFRISTGGSKGVILFSKVGGTHLGAWSVVRVLMGVVRRKC